VQTGDYIIQVRTNASNPGAVAPQTTAATMTGNLTGILTATDSTSNGGHNRFALRANWGTDLTAATNSNLGVFADGALPIFDNVVGGATPTSFYLARVTPNYAGKVLQLQLWDIGDVGSGTTITLTIVPPTDAVNPPTTCTWTLDGTALPGATSAVISGCTASGLQSGSGIPSSDGFNGRLTQAQMSLPSNYSCSSASSTGCWFKINVQLVGSSPSAADTTTWHAVVLGDPVHLTM
jgi:hypothetical protein